MGWKVWLIPGFLYRQRMSGLGKGEYVWIMRKKK